MTVLRARLCLRGQMFTRGDTLTKQGSLDRKILLYLVCDADRSKINGVDMNLTTLH